MINGRIIVQWSCDFDCNFYMDQVDVSDKANKEESTAVSEKGKTSKGL